MGLGEGSVVSFPMGRGVYTPYKPWSKCSIIKLGGRCFCRWELMTIFLKLYPLNCCQNIMEIYRRDGGDASHILVKGTHTQMPPALLGPIFALWPFFLLFLKKFIACYASIKFLF